MIAIKSYSKSKNSDGGATSGKSSAINLSVADSAKKLSEIHTIWGQEFNGTQDIGGDLVTPGEVKASNGFSSNGMKIAKEADKTTFTNGTKYQFDASVIAPKFIGDVEADTVSTDNLLAQEGQIDNLNVEDLEATKAYIKDLLSDNITVDTLTVTKAAHFFSLIIDEIKSVGGQIILSPANATLDMVKATSSGDYKCYFRAQAGDEKISNQFVADDQVVCQTFNVAEGTSYNVSNTFYWRKVISTGTETIDEQDYHYILLSGTDCSEGSGIPQEGDKVVTLGNRNTTDRQNAIVLSAYNSDFLDNGIKAPSIVQYSGINDYDLSIHRLNIISNGLNEFHGNFKISTGEDIGDMINTASYKVKADTLSISVSKDGELSTNTIQASFLKNLKGDVSDVTVVPYGYSFQYLRDDNIIHTYNQDTNVTPFTDFTKDNRSIGCQLLKDGVVVDSVNIPIVADGTDGDDAEFYKLRINSASATVSLEDQLGITVTAEVWKVKGASQQRMDTTGFIVDMVSNAGDVIQLNNDTTYFYYSNDAYKSNYSKQTTPQKYYEVRLWKDTDIIDVFSPITVTFNAGSIFQVKDDAIESAVASVSGDISRIETKADSVTSTVANMSGDISRIETKADNVTSTVANLKVGGKNLLDDSEFLTYSNAEDTTWQKKNGTASKSYGYMDQIGIHAISNPSNVGTSGYLELAEQCLTYKLEPDKEYTLSFYAKGDDGSSTDQEETFLYKGRITTLVYPDVGAVVSDNAKTFMLTSEYQRYSYTFRTKSDLDTTATYQLLFRLISEETDTETYYSNAYICMPKLEEGNMATAWDTSESDMKSIITQTANQITLQVQDIALRIDNKKIVLDGDTEINGSLTMDNSDQGFLLVGDSGNTQISPQSIGTYNTFSNLSTRTVVTSVTSHSTLKEETGVNYYSGSFSTKANLGELPAGSYITLKNHNLSFRKPNSGDILPATRVSSTYTIYENGTSKKTVAITGTSSANIATYTTSAAATITVGLTVTARFQKSYWNSGSDSTSQPSYLEQPTVLGQLYFQSLIPTTAFMLIGYDGLAVNFGNRKTAYFGEESTTIKYGSQGLQINSSGIKKMDPNGSNQWTNLSTLKVKVLPNSDYTLADEDELLIAKNSSYTSDHKLNLPTNTYTGRKIYVKDFSNRTIKVYCSGHLVIANSLNTTDQINVNNTAEMFIFDGTNWYQFYCG